MPLAAAIVKRNTAHTKKYPRKAGMEAGWNDSYKGRHRSPPV